MSTKNSFWHIRAANYDKLFWTKDKSYIDAIVAAGGFTKKDLVLDVGTGTGVMARAIRPHVKHVIGLDFSDSMLQKGSWEGVSLVKWDIADSLFHNNLFDKLVARMVFHHIFDDLDRVLLRCIDLLKKKGRLIVAEGVPPTDDKEVVEWYSHMFSYKEERRTFSIDELVFLLRKNGFKNVKAYIHYTNKFSIKNWLDNSGLEQKKQKKIMDLHYTAPKKIKAAYDMRIKDGDCLINTKNVIIVGENG